MMEKFVQVEIFFWFLATELLVKKVTFEPWYLLFSRPNRVVFLNAETWPNS